MIPASFTLVLSGFMLIAAQSNLDDENDDCLLLQTRANLDDLPSFASYIVQHGRTYVPGSEEYVARQALYEKRVVEVRHHNSQLNQPWTAAVNHFSDRTDEELAQLMGWKGFARVGKPSGRVGLHQAHGSTSKVVLGQTKTITPDDHTWAHLNAIKADVDQEQCGSCWAAATATIMNAADEIAGNNRSFSAQDLVNCVPNPHHCGGTGGCEGSTVELAMNWIATNGLRTQDVSPYFGTDRSCYAGLLQQDGDDNSAPRFRYSDDGLEQMIAIGQHNVQADSLGAKLGLKHWSRLPENEYWPLLTHLVQLGPLGVSVAANGWTMYSRGIFSKCGENPTINHAVVLFGYGYDPEHSLKFWELKNSWGKHWGMNGNIRLPREDTVTCGIDKQPEMGTGCDDGPKEVQVCGSCGILYDVVSLSML